MNSTITGLVLGVVLLTVAVVSGCRDDVESCALNPSDTAPYVCTETEASLCRQIGGCDCTATAPNVAVEGNGCASDWLARCATDFGDVLYYNTEAADLTQLQQSCEDDFMGTWTTSD